MKKKYTILLADDHSILRSGLRSVLNNEPNLKVIAEVDNGKDAMKTAVDLLPDLLLTELTMPKTNGSECILELKKRTPRIKILVLTMHSSEEHVHAALNAGANGYILKGDSLDEFILAINNVLNGKTHLSSSISGNVVKGYLNSSDKSQPMVPWEALTHREREIIKLIAEGYRSKDVAVYLSISNKTVEKHRSNLMKKLDLHSISELTNYVIQNGITDKN